MERQTRAAVVALEDEEKEAETRAVNEPDAEQRERIELRSKASLTGYLRAALEGRQVDGAEAELRSAAGVSGIPLELWDVPQEIEQRQTDAATSAPGTTGINAFAPPCLPIRLRRAWVSRCRVLCPGPMGCNERASKVC